MIAKAEDYSHYVSCDAASCFELLYRRDVAKTRKAPPRKCISNTCRIHLIGARQHETLG